MAIDALVRAESAVVAPNRDAWTAIAAEVVTVRTQGELAGSEDLCAVGYFDGDRLADAAFFRPTPAGTYELAASLSTGTGLVASARWSPSSTSASGRLSREPVSPPARREPVRDARVATLSASCSIGTAYC